MSSIDYIESKWVKGDVISSPRLNNIERGILNTVNEINRVENILGPSVDDGPIESIPTDGFSTEDARLVSVKAIASARGAANGIAPLNANSIIPSQYLPSYVDDVLEFATYDAFPKVPEDNEPNDSHDPSGPEKNKIYVDQSNGRIYRWTGTQYIEIGVNHLDYKDDGSNDDKNTSTVSGNISFGAADTKFVHSVKQSDGKIEVIHKDIAPSISFTDGTTTEAPKFHITIASNNNSEGDRSITIATEGTNGVYGVTRLSNSISTDDSTVAATSKAVKTLNDTIYSTINALDYTDTRENSNWDDSYVKSVTETDGLIYVNHNTFSPSITWTNAVAGTNNSKPSINIEIAGNSATAQTPNEASTTVYGITKLSNDINSASETVAATSKAVKDAIESLDVDNLSAEDVGYSADKAHITGFSADKTLSTLTETDGKIAATFQDIYITSNRITDRGTAGNVATLDENGHVPASQLPSYVDDVLEGTLATFPATGETDKIYVDTETNISYRWSGTQYTKVASDLSLGETSATAYPGNLGKAAYQHAVTNKGIEAHGGTENEPIDGLLKFCTNTEGHIISASAVVKKDITDLGIPAQDTTYETGTTLTSGLTKLYTDYGSNTDGALTQNAFTTLVTSLINNFGLTVQLPSSATISEDTSTGKLTATSNMSGNDIAIEIQKQDSGNTWTTYHEGDSWNVGDIYRAFITRTIQIGSSNFSNSGAVGNTYTTTTKWAPSHTLIIEYTGTDSVINPYTTSIMEGDSYSINSPTVEGYTPDQVIVTGTMGTNDIVITVTYIANEGE